MTVNSFAPVSLEPPLMLWSARRDVPPFEVFAGSNHFALHMLRHGQQWLAERFASVGGNRFTGLETRPGTAGLPLLPGCAAVFECEVRERYPGGDHLILVGEVLAFTHDPAPPLVFHGGRYLD